MSDIYEVAEEVARLIKEKTKFVVGEDGEYDTKDDTEDLIPSTEFWDLTAGICGGAIFYDTVPGSVEVFSDVKTAVVGVVPLADPDFFEKVIDFVENI